MSMFEEHIEAFLEGDLQGEARKAFLLELERDPDKLRTLEEHKRLNEMLKGNTRTAAVPLHTQRALADRIPVLKEINPRLARLAPAADPRVAAPGSGSGSGLLTSSVVRTLKILGVVGVAVVGSWYGVSQFTDSGSTSAEAGKPSEPTIEIAAPATEAENLADADIATDQAAAEATAKSSAGSTQEAASTPVHTNRHPAPDRDARDNEATSTSARQSAAPSIAAAPHSRAGERTASGETAGERMQRIAENKASVSVQTDIPPATPPATDEALAQLPPPVATPAVVTPGTARRALEAERAARWAEVRRIMVFPVEAVDVPYARPVPAAVIVAAQPPLLDELEPETNESRFTGYLESGASGSEILLTGFGGAGTNMYGTYVVGLQYSFGERFRAGMEFGRNPFSRQTVTLTKLDLPQLEGITLYRREAGVASELKSWLQLHGEYVFNPGDAIQMHAVLGYGSVLDDVFIHNFTTGLVSGYDLFPALTLRLGLYFNGAWMPAGGASAQLIALPGQPIGVVSSGETIGTRFSSSMDVRIGLGFHLW